MHRIDTPTAQKDKFGQGKNGFTNGDPTTGTPATGFDEAMFDAFQEEVCTVVERSGIKLNKDQHDQLYQAIRTLSKEDLSRALLKAQNLADLPDKSAARGNLEVYSQSQTDGKYFLKTGGTVNGAVIVEGNQLVLKGDDRKHLGFHNQDGSVRMWLYKDKGGDGVHLNNGEDGGGDWLFHKNGNFHAPSGIVAGGNVTVSWGGRTAHYHENGDVTGPIWGGTLSGWANNRVNDALRTSADFSVDGNNWWFRDNRRGLIFQGGYRDGQNGDRVIERVALNIHVPNRLLYVGTTIVNFAQGFDTSWNHQVANLSGEKDGFTWIHGWAEQKMYWMAVGY